jgi:hypothetical protein
MGKQKHELSPNAIAVPEMIAAGCSYEQILAAYPHLTHLDIFQSAATVTAGHWPAALRAC